VTSRLEYDDSYTLARYLATGGYKALRKALAMFPEEVAPRSTSVVARARGCRLSRRAQVVDVA